MSPVTHFLAGWIIANASERLQRSERALITAAAVTPDLDGLGIIAELLTRDMSQPLTWYADFHHVLAHNLGFGLLAVAAVFALSTQRWLAAGLAALNFHSHILFDLIGSRSPDGYQWPIPYLLPFSNRWQLVWSGQWELNAWPNFAITIAALGVVFALACRRGYSPLEMVSASANRAFVETLRRRFPTCARGRAATTRHPGPE